MDGKKVFPCGSERKAGNDTCEFTRLRVVSEKDFLLERSRREVDLANGHSERKRKAMRLQNMERWP